MRIKKYHDILVAEDKPITATMRVGGKYKCVLRDLMGNSVYESDWKDNTILTVGLPSLYSSTAFANLYIGDDATPPNTPYPRGCR